MTLLGQMDDEFWTRSSLGSIRVHFVGVTMFTQLSIHEQYIISRDSFLAIVFTTV